MSVARPWRIGFVPLTDAAVLLAAAERGFAAEAGTAIELVPQPSWAALRDELALGHLDAAHMLAPLAVAIPLGLSGRRADLVAPFVLNRNGNAVTLSVALWRALEEAGAGEDLSSRAGAFVLAGRARARAGRRLRLGTVFPYSCHTDQWRRFARLGGGELEAFAELVVVPPPETAAALGAGTIDGFCVGSPWNSVAVDAGTGRIAAFGSEIAPESLEKVLTLPRHRLAEAAVLLAGLRRAAAWCADPASRPVLARLLAEPRHRLGVGSDIVLRTLEGRLTVSPEGVAREDPRYIVLDPAPATPQDADAIADGIAATVRLDEPDAARAAVRTVLLP